MEDVKWMMELKTIIHFFMSSGIELSMLLAYGKKVDNSPTIDKNL